MLSLKERTLASKNLQKRKISRFQMKPAKGQWHKLNWSPFRKTWEGSEWHLTGEELWNNRCHVIIYKQFSAFTCQPHSMARLFSSTKAAWLDRILLEYKVGFPTTTHSVWNVATSQSSYTEPCKSSVYYCGREFCADCSCALAWKRFGTSGKNVCEKLSELKDWSPKGLKFKIKQSFKQD